MKETYLKQIENIINTNKEFLDETQVILNLSHLLYLDIDYYSQAFDNAIKELESKGYIVSKYELQYIHDENTGEDSIRLNKVDKFSVGNNHKPELIIEWGE